MSPLSPSLTSLSLALAGVKARRAGYHVLWDDAGRLAAAKQRYRDDPPANPQTVLDFALAAVLDPDESARRSAADVVVANLRYAVDLLDHTPSCHDPTANGSDTYRWNQWVPVAFDWVRPYLADDDLAYFYATLDPIVRAVMRQPWGGPDMPLCNYSWGNLNWEWTWARATRDLQDVSDIDAVWKARWEHFLAWAADPANGPAGVQPSGSEYGGVGYSYCVLPWLADRGYFAAGGGADWWAASVRWLAQAVSPVPVRQGRGDTYYYQYPNWEDDEGWDGYPFFGRGNYLPTYLYAAQELCSGLPEAGYAAQVLRTTGCPPDTWLKYAVAPAAPRPPDTLPLVSPYGCVLVVRQSWRPDATVLYFHLHHGRGGPYGHWGDVLHGSLGSVQVQKNGRWLLKNQAGYATQFWAGGVLGRVPAEHFGCNSVPWMDYGDYGAYGPSGDGVPGHRITDDGDLVTVALDLKPVWPVASNPASASRTFRYRRSADTLQVVDAIDDGYGDIVPKHVRWCTVEQPARKGRVWYAPGLTVTAPADAAFETGFFQGTEYGGYFLDTVTTAGQITHTLSFRPGTTSVQPT